MMANKERLNSLEDSYEETDQKCLLYSQAMGHSEKKTNSETV